ncbi:MFS transporter [Sphingobacterium alkalisoli]|uniref:MFS transporter n=1 Tax=Sphingobacterium alkalisoli TaxID=1874115 RepID=A0A4U0GTL5_9SPHI|nr:MFS transporter [Sphingobacterium alkalisoli]TJY62391.1 MFS transporter [Sphingobacterium alkalisoli]GGH29741.1 MFS transporter [Sphingobacterium alkalisoli]
MENKKWLRTYLFIWSGQFISMLTSYAVHFAVIIWLSLEHKSAEILAYAGIAAMLPQAIIGPFVGVFIDRWNRKKVMIFSDAFLALCALIMVFLLQNETVNLNWVYLMLAFRSVGNAFHSPAMQAIAPLIVPEKDLLRVSGINQMLQSGSSIAGPAVGTLAITYLSISNVLYLDVIGAAAAIISLLFVTIPHIKTEARLSINAVVIELKEGFNAVLKNKGLSFLFFYAMMVTFFIMPAAIMFPLLTTGHYGGGKWEMSIIEIVWGIGMLIGGTVLGVFKVKASKVILINAMHLVLGLSFILCGWLPSGWFVGFAAATILSGIALSVFSASFTTILQLEVAPGMLGRVFSLYFSVAVLPSVIGLLFTGLIAERIGVANAFLICGGLVILIGILSFLTPSLMKLGRSKTVEQQNM